MRRLLVGVIAASVFLFGAHASTLHVHAYADHDHEEHHHGPAAHDHDGFMGGHEPLHVSACDPAAHVVRIPYSPSPKPDIHPLAADVAIAVISPRPLETFRAAQLLDVRGHSPPHARLESLRAPPLQTLL